ncbi:MAG TPA: restriction endonuclease [Gemmatimonadales bacterium]|nr:restriction endonuclease [Gemmatimonadales bacterium]
MRELPDVTPEYLEILVVRELRKAGLEVSEVRRHRRIEPPDGGAGFLLELVALLSQKAWRRRALITCLRQAAPVNDAAVREAGERTGSAGAEVALLWAAGDLDPGAIAAAEAAGVGLVRVVDARTAFDLGGWGTPGQYPSWLPAHVAQVVSRDSAGRPRYELLEAGRAELIVTRLKDQTERRTEGGSHARPDPGA